MSAYDAALRVARAWTTPGLNPWRHALAKKRLRREWPALAKAVEDLVAELDEAERGSPP